MKLGRPIKANRTSKQITVTPYCKDRLLVRKRQWKIPISECIVKLDDSYKHTENEQASTPAEPV